MTKARSGRPESFASVRISGAVILATEGCSHSLVSKQSILRSALAVQYLMIDDILPDRIAVERAQDIARGLFAHAVDSFARDAGDMGSRDHVGQAEQGIFDRWGLLREHIEAGTGQSARRQRVIKCLLVDDAATRGVEGRR